ncbi:MAG: IPExxxVDY family protein [Bacteroidales bacterium]|nr:IPExxxVDY family protein [Bacteroidales bacterium]
MNSRDKKIQIASFEDTTVIGINSSLTDYKLAWSINKQLSIDLVRYDDLVFEGAQFSFFYYTAGENYNVYNLVSLVCKEKVLFPFKPRLDYLFLIQNTLSAERQINIMRSLREIEGIVHAFVLEKDKNLRQVLETIAECEQQMMDKKKKLNDIYAVRKKMKEEEEKLAALREKS